MITDSVDDFSVSLIIPQPVKDSVIILKCAQIGGAQLQCVTNHYAKFEHKGIEILAIQMARLVMISK